MRWTPWMMTAILAAGCTSGPSDKDTDVATDSDPDTAVPADTDDTGLIANDSGANADTDTVPVDTDVADTDPNACGPGEVRDCNNECFSQIIIGDNFCDDGPAPQADFNCSTFNDDDGDCSNAGDTDDTDVVVVDTGISDVPCTALYDIRDCNGLCYPSTWLGDARCDQGVSFPWGSPDFDCFSYQHDHGDCVTDTGVSDTDTGVSDTDTGIISFDTWPPAPDTADTAPVVDTDIVPVVDTDTIPLPP